MTVQGVKSFLKTHRTAVILSSVGVMIVGALTAYVLWSVSTWSQYETVSKAWHEEVKADTSSVLALPADTAEKRNHKRTALKAVTNEIQNEGAAICTPHGLLDWQRSMAYAKPKVEACQKQVAVLEEFRNSLNSVTDYLENEQSVTSAFAAAGYPEKISDKDLGAQVTAWQNVDSLVSKITPVTSFSPVKTEAANVAKAIIAAWQAVIVANEAKDKKKYEDSVAGLTAAYKGIEGVTARSTQQFDQLSRALEEKYKLAF